TLHPFFRFVRADFQGTKPALGLVLANMPVTRRAVVIEQPPIWVSQAITNASQSTATLHAPPTTLHPFFRFVRADFQGTKPALRLVLANMPVTRRAVVIEQPPICYSQAIPHALHSSPTRRSSDLTLHPFFRFVRAVLLGAKPALAWFSR